MAENLFSTPREKSLSADQMLENAVQRRQLQRQNLAALTESRKLSSSIPDYTATMKSSNAEAEAEIQKNTILEQKYYQQGTKNLNRMKLGLRSSLMESGRAYVTRKVLLETIYESYWLDEPVKEATVEGIEETVSNILDYVAENCSDSKVEDKKQTNLIKAVKEAIEETVSEAVERIVREAEESDTASTDFSLSEEEENKLDDKLTDLGRDEIIDLIKTKVANVIQDEKERGQKRAEMFDDINQALQDKPEYSTGEDDTNTEDESTTEGMIFDGSITPMQKYQQLVSVTSLVDAISGTSDNSNYTPNERAMIASIESGATPDLQTDPLWTNCKVFVSTACKKVAELIQSAINTCNPETFANVECILNSITKTLSDLQEDDVPTDVKEFISGMVGLIYSSVPIDECVISRITNPIGSYGVTSATSMAMISWADLLTNIKVNLASIKNYCQSKAMNCMEEKVTQESVVPQPKSLSGMVAVKQMRAMNRNMGSSIFESFMMNNLSSCASSTMEASMPVSDDDIDGAALIESILDYTVLETLDTLGIYKFRMNDINSMKRALMEGVSKAENPITTSDGTEINGSKKKSLSQDKNISAKKVRINTLKMKHKSKEFNVESE